MQQEFIRGLGGIKPAHAGCVATIGSFDGVHRGHKAIIQRLKSVAAGLNLPSLVMIFEPQPHEYFSREKAPPRLMRLREKVMALHALGVDRVLCLKFDAQFRSLTARGFVEQVLIKKLDVRHLEIGDDFRFGCDRQGNFALLQAMGREHGFAVCDTPTFTHNGERISSTRVRQLLEQNALAAASELLGEPFAIRGRVIYGRQLGRTIGVPTANVGLGRYRSPVQGVYAVKVTLPGRSAAAEGVANVGVKPTVAGDTRPVLEVHLFDFNEPLYGQCIEVTFCHKLRKEQKFASVAELKAQITNDMTRAREYFAQTGGAALDESEAQAEDKSGKF